MVLMVLFISLFSSCSKNDVECNFSPVIVVAKSVLAGGDIELKTENVEFAEFIIGRDLTISFQKSSVQFSRMCNLIIPEDIHCG